MIFHRDHGLWLRDRTGNPYFPTPEYVAGLIDLEIPFEEQRIARRVRDTDHTGTLLHRCLEEIHEEMARRDIRPRYDWDGQPTTESNL